MATVAIPTLSTTSYISDPPTVLAYILRHYAAAPKNATVTWYNETISLKDTISKFGSSREAIVEPVIADLTGVFQRLFPTGRVTVLVETIDIPESSAYNLKVTVTVVISDVTYSVNHTATVTEDGRLQFGV